MHFDAFDFNWDELNRKVYVTHFDTSYHYFDGINMVCLEMDTLGM